MSWSITFIGKTENIVSALGKYSESLSGGSKVEFDAAMPALITLLNQNFANDDDPIMQLIANGHGYDTHRQCQVELKNIGGMLV